MANLKILSENSTLDQLADVNPATPNDGDVLTWDATPGEWVPLAPGGGPGGGLTYEQALSLVWIG